MLLRNRNTTVNYFLPNEKKAEIFSIDDDKKDPDELDRDRNEHDRTLSGEVLVNLSLCSSCIMTFEKKGAPPVPVTVPL